MQSQLRTNRSKQATAGTPVWSGDITKGYGFAAIGDNRIGPLVGAGKCAGAGTCNDEPVF